MGVVISILKILGIILLVILAVLILAFLLSFFLCRAKGIFLSLEGFVPRYWA